MYKYISWGLAFIGFIGVCFLVYLIIDTIDKQDKNYYSDQIKLIRERIEWCHSQKGVVIVEADRYGMKFKSCTLPPN